MYILSAHADFYQHIQTPSDLTIFLNWYATEEITRQLEILLRKLTAQAKLNSAVYKTLVMPNNLTSRQVPETLIIKIPFGRLRLQKHSEQCRRTAGKINIHEISNYQLSKDQLDNTADYMFT